MNEVSLQMMLDCREKRASEQKKLVMKYRKPVISFTMNIAGPVKTSYLIERAFCIGVKKLSGALASCGIAILEKKLGFEITGPQGFFVVDSDAANLKNICVSIEEEDCMGRLFDIDVTDSGGVKLERQIERGCLICGKPGRECAAGRIHSVQELADKTNEILEKHVYEHDCDDVASLAVRALLYEVAVTPKPGLVDTINSGSHTDMDIYTFITSSVSLYPYFRNAYSLGIVSENEKECFIRLRELGKKAERTMFGVTGGVNTHKGAVFSLGIVCAAAGFTAGKNLDIYKCCSKMTAGITNEDLGCVTLDNCKTKGQYLYAKYKIRGIRGELEDGLPAVRNNGLPVLEKCLSEGFSNDVSGSNALLAIISAIDDTSLVSRGGTEEADSVKRKISSILNNGIADRKCIEDLDSYFIEKNLSPGGAADLLAICFLIHFLKENFYV